VLKKVASCGASVLFTIHQPNSQMFSMIHHLVFLKSGRCMYNGSVESLPAYFGNRGFAVPQNYNPADWILTVSEELASTEQLEKSGFFVDFPESDKVDARRAGLNTNLSIFKLVEKKTGLNVAREIALLLKRGFANTVRDRKILILRFGIIVIGAIFIAISFANVGSGDIGTASELQSHIGAVFFLLMASSIITQVILLEFIEERPLLIRESSTGHYRLFSYIASRLVIDAVTIGLQMLLFLFIVYWSFNLQGSFLVLYLIMFVFGMVSSSIAVALGSYTSDPRDAKELIPMTLRKLVFELCLNLHYMIFFSRQSSASASVQWLLCLFAINPFTPEMAHVVDALDLYFPFGY